MPRFFVAIPLSSSVKSSLEPLLFELSSLGLGTVVLPGKLHITLYFLGDISASELTEVIAKLQLVAEGLTPSLLYVGGVGSFGDRVIWAGVKGEWIFSLMYQIRHAFFGQDHDSVPHVSLCYVKLGGGGAGDFVNSHASDVFGDFLCDTIILYKSELAYEGPIYSVVREFKFGRF